MAGAIACVQEGRWQLISINMGQRAMITCEAGGGDKEVGRFLCRKRKMQGEEGGSDHLCVVDLWKYHENFFGGRKKFLENTRENNLAVEMEVECLELLEMGF